MSESGFYITRCKKGGGLRLVWPNGSVCHISVIKSTEGSAEIMVKTPKEVIIKKFTEDSSK